MQDSKKDTEVYSGLLDSEGDREEIKLRHIRGKNHTDNDDPVCKTAKKTQMCTAEFWTQRERERVG